MKVIEKQSSVLTNWEVLNIVREQKAEHDGTDGTSRTRPMPINLSRVLTDVRSLPPSHQPPLTTTHTIRRSKRS